MVNVQRKQARTKNRALGSMIRSPDNLHQGEVREVHESDCKEQ